jgi:hypothetical protein
MITIDTKPTGETTLFIAAPTLIDAIRTLDRARAALAALDDSPLPAPTEEALATLRALHAEAAAAQEQPQPVVVPAQEETALPVAIPQEQAAQEQAAQEEANAATLREEIAVVGKKMFGEEWPQAKRWLISGWTSKRTPENIRTNPLHLTADECEAVLVGLCDNAETTRASWQKQKEADAAKARQTTPATPAQSSARPGRQPRTAASLTAPRRPAPGTAAHTAMVNGAITG